MNGIDENISTNTHKSVQQHIHKSTSPDDSYSELCAYPIQRDHKSWRSTGDKIYLQATKDIDKEADKLNILVSNDKDSIDHFLSLANKYGWVLIAFMVDTGAE